MTELVTLASGYQILEAPRPDLDGSVWFSDLTGGVHRLTDAGDVELVVPPGEALAVSQSTPTAGRW